MHVAHVQVLHRPSPNVRLYTCLSTQSHVLAYLCKCQMPQSLMQLSMDYRPKRRKRRRTENDEQKRMRMYDVPFFWNKTKLVES